MPIKLIGIKSLANWTPKVAGEVIISNGWLKYIDF
jgi:hypothetical protein